jgi:hypothetical protein
VLELCSHITCICCCTSNTLSTVHTAYHPLSKTKTNNSQCWKPYAAIQVQSTLLTTGVKTPETCWDTTDWINHYLLHLVGLTLDYLCKMQGQTNLKIHHVIKLLETNLILCNCYICICVCVNILTTYVEKLCYCKTLLNKSSQDQKKGFKLCNFKLSNSLCAHLPVI